MSDTPKLRDPILVAIWPGMGSVALIAGDYLLQQIRARRIDDLDMKEFFDVQSVEVFHGIATIGHLPQNRVFEWNDPNEKHDLLVFMGEVQPLAHGLALCKRVIDYAASRGVKEVFTFAAMATQLKPGATAQAFAVATDQPTLAKVCNLGAQPLESGQISGLNGILLAAAAHSGLHGTCLLGELPYFAASAPNPGAALAVLEKFTQLLGIKIDLGTLAHHAQAVNAQIKEFFQMLQQQHVLEKGLPEQDLDGSEPVPRDGLAAENRKPLDPVMKAKIEALFEKAKQDRTKAVELKHELDRLGLFKQYEDRFLDLFRNAA